MSFWVEFLRILIRENREAEKEVVSFPKDREITSDERRELSAKIKKKTDTKIYSEGK
jgi:ribosome recycling factor